MSDVKDLLARINAEVSAHREKVAQLRTEVTEEAKGRQERLVKLEQVFEQLRGVWTPRLQSLIGQFKDSVQVTPTVTPGRRQGKFEFKSPVAHITLRFTASTDSEVKNVVLAYDLDILPIYMQFEKHVEVAFPLDQVDEEAAANWFDDRIVGFVKVYLSLHENEYYLRDHMVEDPVAKVKFPKFVAGATLERGGKTYYFISEDTRREFEKSSP
jgi:YHS domain-containing protein/FtsZ-binding cell division protein ZapB